MRFGASLDNVKTEDFTDVRFKYEIDADPYLINIFTKYYDVAFNKAWANRSASNYYGKIYYVIGETELIEAKKSSDKPEDSADLKKLTSITGRTQYSSIKPRL